MTFKIRFFINLWDYLCHLFSKPRIIDMHNTTARSLLLDSIVNINCTRKISKRYCVLFRVQVSYVHLNRFTMANYFAESECDELFF